MTCHGANNLNQYLATDNEDGACPTPATPTESFGYDGDGNLIADGTFTYTWDGENRLIRVQTRVELGLNTTEPDANDKLLEFAYDYMNRRVRKTVKTHNGTGWVESSDQLFVYDRWNVVAVLDANASNALVRKYTWGLDLSGWSGDASPGGIHGAGGIGGLLAMVETGGTYAGTYWYLYDANGNVGQVLNATDAQNITTAAKYEYDPFGRNTGTYGGAFAASNPFQFSTKWLDAETGMYCYGERYYLPRIGRWGSRDPIAERDDLRYWHYMDGATRRISDGLSRYGNVIAFASNNPISRVDVLGLRDCSTCWRTCLDSQAQAPADGYVICREDGCQCACTYLKTYPQNGDSGDQALLECALEHEEYHVRSPRGYCPKCCATQPCFKKVLLSKQKDEECFASAVGIRCLMKKMPSCNGDLNCEDKIIKEIKVYEDYCRRYGGDVYEHLEALK